MSLIPVKAWQTGGYHRIIGGCHRITATKNDTHVTLHHVAILNHVHWGGEAVIKETAIETQTQKERKKEKERERIKFYLES